MHVLVVSNGFPPPKDLLEAEFKKADLVVGADGGGNKILKYGLLPNVIIGDLDSFEKPKDVDFEIIHEPEQETNDLEKALSLVITRGADTCTVLGAFGKRMDHALKNLSVLKKFDAAFKKLIYKDELFEASIINGTFSEECPVGNLVSLFPLSGEVTGIVTEGLKFPLNNESLKNGERDGTSNETISDQFSVSVESGDLVIFVERR
ncbi:thiamine diphosphokinase [Gracilimonas sp.]|uniref:thiamine diphosphokinase n=1 Tax=Gracilimonas sp. TaxID=1974203 RepID=UPI00287247C7|nr:thiamine diphosphokinase [Gracilimonas sp.]